MPLLSAIAHRLLPQLHSDYRLELLVG